MATKTFNNVRLNFKHDTEENWLKATNFIPNQGEPIVYDIDSTYTYERFKIGDGITNVNNLPFINVTIDDVLSNTSTNPIQNKVITIKLNEITNLLDNHTSSSDTHITSDEKTLIAKISTLEEEIATLKEQQAEMLAKLQQAVFIKQE